MLERCVYLIGLCSRNEIPFYKTLMSDPARFVPIVYDPTIADACLAFGHLCRRSRGMYVTRDMKGCMAEVLRNWPYLAAANKVFPGVCVHFEDWKGTDAIRLLARYSDKVLCYNDDIQDTASVTIAGLTTALQIGGTKLKDQRMLFLGAGSAAIGLAVYAYVAESVMLVTALSPVIGYEKSAHIAQQAMRDGSTLKQAALASGDVDEAMYDKMVGPKSMVGQGVGGA